MRDKISQLTRLRDLRQLRAQRKADRAQEEVRDAQRAHEMSGNLVSLRTTAMQTAERQSYDALAEKGADGQMLTAMLTNLDGLADALRDAERKRLERYQHVETAKAAHARAVIDVVKLENGDEAWQALTRRYRMQARRRLEDKAEDALSDLARTMMIQQHNGGA